MSLVELNLELARVKSLAAMGLIPPVEAAVVIMELQRSIIALMNKAA